MGLTDREKKILEEMEQAFKSEDPRLVSTIERATARPKKFLLNLALILLGISLLLAGVITKISLIGIAGFGIALLGAATFHFSGRGLKAPKGRSLQDRWNKRQ